jgi:hypothetical protein
MSCGFDWDIVWSVSRREVSLLIIITVYFGGLAVSLNINKIQSRECNRLLQNSAYTTTV